MFQVELPAGETFHTIGEVLDKLGVMPTKVVGTCIQSTFIEGENVFQLRIGLTEILDQPDGLSEDDAGHLRAFTEKLYGCKALLWTTGPTADLLLFGSDKTEDFYDFGVAELNLTRAYQKRQTAVDQLRETAMTSDGSR